jgi:hypothetical protein
MIWSLLGLSAAIFSFTGCNDSSSPLGSDFLPSDVEFHTITLNADQFQVNSGIAAIANTSSLSGASVLVGRASDGTVAHGLLAITSRPERLANITPGEVQSARLRLQAFNYLYGDSTTRSATFDVVTLDGSLNQDTQWEDVFVGTIDGATSLGSYDNAYPDSTREAISLDPALVGEFLQNNLRIDTVDGVPQTTVLKYLALRARPEATAIGSWVGVDFLDLGDSVRPMLEITLADTTIELLIDVSSWIAQVPIETGEGRIALAGGAPVRSWLKFPLDSIPDDAIIHKAEMLLHADPDASVHGTSGVTNYVVVYVADDSVRARTSFTDANGNADAAAFRSTIDENTFGNEFRISTLAPVITSWLRFRSGRSSNALTANHGLILALNRNASLRAPLETGTVDRLMLHGPAAAVDSLRPKLTITYSIQTDAK